MGDFVCLLTEAEHKGPHNRECPRYARPTAPSPAGSAGDVEALANWFWQHEHGHVCSNHPGGHLCSRQCVSSALVRSPWLAAHTRALAADRERLVEAVVVLASAACVCGGTAACFTCQTAVTALTAPHDDRGPGYVAEGTEEGSV